MVGTQKKASWGYRTSPHSPSFSSAASRDSVTGRYYFDPDGDYERVAVATGEFSTARERTVSTSAQMSALRPVLVDGCFRSRAQRAAVRALADRHGVPFYFVEVRVGRETQRERLCERSRRDGEPDETWLDIAQALRQEWEPPDELAATQRLRIDTDRPLAASLEALRSALPTWPEGLTG